MFSFLLGFFLWTTHPLWIYQLMLSILTIASAFRRIENYMFGLLPSQVLQTNQQQTKRLKMNSIVEFSNSQQIFNTNQNSMTFIWNALICNQWICIALTLSIVNFKWKTIFEVHSTIGHFTINRFEKDSYKNELL